MKRWMVVVLVIFVVLVGGFFTVFCCVCSTQAWTRALELPDRSLAPVADVAYEGTSRLNLLCGTAAANTTARVRVTVRDQRYVAVEVIARESSPIWWIWS